MTTGGERFDRAYRDAATPWDIGGPQPAVRRLVAFGAVKGDVLDPGTGPGHHAIHFAAHGYRATGIDISETAIQRARRNADAAGVAVNFAVADAKTLDGYHSRFDTVVDTAFYNTFAGDDDTQHGYLRALHRATRPGARLYLIEAADYNINGFFMPPKMSADDFRRALPAAGWQISYLGPTSYLVNVSAAGFDSQVEQSPDAPPRIRQIAERLRAIEPYLDGELVHAPFWEVHAARVG